MKYVCLLYHAEPALRALSPEQSQALADELEVRPVSELARSGHDRPGG